LNIYKTLLAKEVVSLFLTFKEIFKFILKNIKAKFIEK
jgi:hypothetical protein